MEMNKCNSPRRQSQLRKKRGRNGLKAADEDKTGCMIKSLLTC